MLPLSGAVVKWLSVLTLFEFYTCHHKKTIGEEGNGKQAHKSPVSGLSKLETEDATQFSFSRFPKPDPASVDHRNKILAISRTVFNHPFAVQKLLMRGVL